MKKQIYAVRELNILTSDEEARMNYLQLRRSRENPAIILTHLTGCHLLLIYSQESHKALTHCHNGFLSV